MEKVKCKYFTEEEFQKTAVPCSLQDMNPAFMAKLDKAREIAGVPFVVTCAFRSVEHELKQGRSGKSSHTKGLAVDIRTPDSRRRFRVMYGLMQAGFTRLGYNVRSKFIHVDDDMDKDRDVLFDY